MCAASASHAEYVFKSVTGGVFHDNSGDHPYSQTGNECRAQGQAVPGTASCSGEIVVEYEWENGGDPTNLPPLSVVTYEESNVSCGGNSYVSMSCSSGLDNEVRSESGSSISARGYRYKVVKGENPLKIKCTPTTRSTNVYGYAGVSLSYKWSIQEIGVSLHGTTDTSNTRYVLTGQQITANLVGATLAPNTIPTWSLSTGSDLCFGDFKISDTTDTSTTPPTTITQGKSEVSPIETNVIDFKFYTKKDGSVVAKCSASIVLGDNTIAAVEAQSKSITSVRPSVNEWEIRTGFVGWDSYNINYNRDPLLSVAPDDYMRFRGYRGGTSREIAHRGQDWYALVNVPAPLSGGNIMWAQIVKAERHAFLPAIPTDRDAPFGQNGVTGLDNEFPYEGDIRSVEVEGNTGDSPGQPKQGNKITASDSFQTWLMFRPDPAVPGQSTTYIPLQKYSWSWSGTAQIDTTNSASQEVWKIVSSSAVFNPLTPPTVTTENTYDFPIWTAKIVGRRQGGGNATTSW